MNRINFSIKFILVYKIRNCEPFILHIMLLYFSKVTVIELLWWNCCNFCWFLNFPYTKTLFSWFCLMPNHYSEHFSRLTLDKSARNEVKWANTYPREKPCFKFFIFYWTFFGTFYPLTPLKEMLIATKNSSFRVDDCIVVRPMALLQRASSRKILVNFQANFTYWRWHHSSELPHSSKTQFSCTNYICGSSLENRQTRYRILQRSKLKNSNGSETMGHTWTPRPPFW